MTPYKKSYGDGHYAGATFDLDSAQRDKVQIRTGLEKMKALNMNTVTIYGFEDESKDLRDYIFSELKRLGMRIVIRIERYDAESFAFTKSDAKKVLESHYDILEYISSSERKGQVAYLAVNMPVDDTAVQKNAGGLNSKKWKNAQVEYADEMISLLRSYLSGQGFSDAKLYLSVHYGWDNSFDIPSYGSAGADGYFINCYSYPYIRYGYAPKADAERDILIDSGHIDECMEIYKGQYGNAATVIEFGFHTMEYNGWKKTNQTAGLVWDREAKARAMQETVGYYEEAYPFVDGWLYFGYNLLKEEGDDGAVMDWCLEYPATNIANASNAFTSGSATKENGKIFLNRRGDSVVFYDLPELQEIVIDYRSTEEASIKIKTNGRVKKTINLPAAENGAKYPVPLVVVDGYRLEIENNSNASFEIASIYLLDNLEAEFSWPMYGEDKSASSGKYAIGINDPNNPISFLGVRGGERIKIRYESPENCILYFVLDGKSAKLPLNASPKFVEIEAKLPIYRDATISLYSNSPNLKLDYIKMEGIPGARK